MDAIKDRVSMNVPVFFIIGLSIMVAIILATALTGCYSKNGGQVLFEDGLNLQIGHSIEDMEKFPHKKSITEQGKIEYIFSNKNGCEWAYVVNENGIIESWYYVSDPSLCKSRFGLGPF